NNPTNATDPSGLQAPNRYLGAGRGNFGRGDQYLGAGLGNFGGPQLQPAPTLELRTLADAVKTSEATKVVLTGLGKNPKNLREGAIAVLAQKEKTGYLFTGVFKGDKKDDVIQFVKEEAWVVNNEGKENPIPGYPGAKGFVEAFPMKDGVSTIDPHAVIQGG